MIDDGALNRLGGLFEEEREEAAALSARTEADLKAGRPVEFPERFGKYGLIRELGRGGLGRVWLAWDPELHRFVALKTLTAAGDVDRLLREARSAAALDHPRVAKVYEVGEAHGVSYLVLQYLEGASLEGKTLEPLEAARVVRDASRILAEAHRRGIIHRDVKPGNLMISGGEVWVVDFGLARPAGGTGSLAVAGTLSYMSPEQARGEAPGPSADVYSLGATLYRLAVGRPPVEARDVSNLSALWDSIPRPSSVRSGFPRSLEAVIVRALEPAGRRHGGADELADDLDRVLRGERIPTRGKPGRWALAAALFALAAGAAWRQRAVGRELRAAELAVKAERFEEAARCLDLAGTWPGTGAARESLERARGEALRRNVDRVRALLEQARVDQYRKGARLTEVYFRSLDGALAGVRRCLGAGGDGEARLWLGRAAMLAGDWAEARQNFEAVLAADPRRGAEARIGLARAWTEEAAGLLVKGQDGEAALLLANARRVFDQVPGLARRLAEGSIGSDLAAAWSLLAAGDPQGALDLAERRAPVAEDFHLVSATARARLGRPEEARSSLSAALDVRPNYPEAYLLRAFFQAQEGDLAGAHRDLKQALELHPRHPGALAARAERERRSP